MIMESWQEQARFIGTIIHDFSVLNKELEPLATSYINFAHKFSVEVQAIKGGGMGVNLKRVRTVLTAFEQAGLVMVDKVDYEKLVKAVDRQSDEIEALELRIKRLLKESPAHSNKTFNYKAKACL